MGDFEDKSKNYFAWERKGVGVFGALGASGLRKLKVGHDSFTLG